MKRASWQRTARSAAHSKARGRGVGRSPKLAELAADRVTVLGTLAVCELGAKPPTAAELDRLASALALEAKAVREIASELALDAAELGSDGATQPTALSAAVSGTREECNA